MAKYTVIVEKDEDGGLVFEVVGVPGCHTQAKTMNEWLARANKAIQSYVEAVKDGKPSESFAGVQLLDG